MGLLDEVLGSVMRGQQQQQQQPQQGGAGGGLGDLLGGLFGAGQQSQQPQDHSLRPGQYGDGDGGAGGGLGGLFGGAHAGAGGSGGSGGGLADVLGGLLGNDGHAGGLGGILDRFRQAGLGEQADSWVGTGPNAPVSGEQVSQALGHDTLSNLASRFGLNASMLSGLLASVLPMLIDRFTPHGQLPEHGLGDQQDVRRRLTDSL